MRCFSSFLIPRLLVLGVTACGGGSSISTELEGVYSVTTWTENATTCDAEGGSVAVGRQMFFYVLLHVDFPILEVHSCDEVASCQADAASEDGGDIGDGGFAFLEGSDSTGWQNVDAFGFPTNTPGECNGTTADTVMTSLGTSLRIEQRSNDSFAFSASDCGDDSTVEAAAAQAPCESLEVVTLALTADLE